MIISIIVLFSQRRLFGHDLLVYLSSIPKALYIEFYGYALCKPFFVAWIAFPAMKQQCIWHTLRPNLRSILCKARWSKTYDTFRDQITSTKRPPYAPCRSCGNPRLPGKKRERFSGKSRSFLAIAICASSTTSLSILLKSAPMNPSSMDFTQLLRMSLCRLRWKKEHGKVARW